MGTEVAQTGTITGTATLAETQTPAESSKVWVKEETGIDWPRLRFASCVAIFGGAVGVVTVLVHFLALIQYPNIIQHLTIWDSLLFGTGGALGGILITAPTAYLLFGERPEFASLKDRPPRGIRAWAALGILYGLTYPLIMGGVFIPLSFNIIDFNTGHLSVPQLLFKSLEGGIFAPSIALVLGIRLLYTGLYSALLFAPGGWALDRFNASRDPISRKYGTWAVAVLFSALVIAIVVYAPPIFLANFGGGAQNRF